MAKVKCKQCGKIMNIPRGHADICYECTYPEEDKELGRQDKEKLWIHREPRWGLK